LPAERLQQRLTFQQRTTVDDDFGNSQSTFATVFTEPAELIIPRLGNEAVVAARLAGQQAVTIRVRRNSKTIQIQADWRAVDARNTGVIYALTAAPVDREQKRQWLEIPATLGIAA
jgi:head-tail adaptor